MYTKIKQDNGWDFITALDHLVIFAIPLFHVKGAKLKFVVGDERAVKLQCPQALAFLALVPGTRLCVQPQEGCVQIHPKPALDSSYLPLINPIIIPA